VNNKDGDFIKVVVIDKPPKKKLPLLFRKGNHAMSTAALSSSRTPSDGIGTTA
jgi:hypothetical protein